MSVLTQSQKTRSVLLSCEVFDNAPIVEVGNEAVGFPATNLQDPQPKVRWRTTNEDNAFFVADMESFFGEAPFIDTFFLGFASLWDQFGPLERTASTWRIRMGTFNGTWTFDTGEMVAWPHDGTPPTDADYRNPVFYQPRGAHVWHHLDAPLKLRFVRVDLGGDPWSQSAGFTRWEVGRFACGLALQPIVPYPAPLPSPQGSPPKPVVTWPVRLTQEQQEGIAYGLAFNRGNAPRFIDSWGHDRHLLDGGKTLVAVNNVAAEQPWQRQQQTVYGYIEQLDETRRTRSQLVDASLTIRGL